jgi:hypothetical protein
MKKKLVTLVFAAFFAIFMALSPMTVLASTMPSGTDLTNDLTTDNGITAATGFDPYADITRYAFSIDTTNPKKATMTVTFTLAGTVPQNPTETLYYAVYFYFDSSTTTGRTDAAIILGSDMTIYLAHTPRTGKWVCHYTNYETGKSGAIRDAAVIDSNFVTLTFPIKLLNKHTTFDVQVGTWQYDDSVIGSIVNAWDLAPNYGETKAIVVI